MTSFEKAATAIKDSGKEEGMQKISNAEKLSLYGLYKQGTTGDNTTGQPWAVQLEARAKWDAWTANKGKSQDAAQSEYVELVKSLLNKYNAAKFIVGFWFISRTIYLITILPLFHIFFSDLWI